MKSTYRTIADIQEAMKNKKVSVPELAQEYIIKADKWDQSLHAFLSVSDERLMDAVKIQKCLDGRNGFHSPLAGIPYGLKDNISTLNMRTTCASKMLKDYRPPYSATAAERLKRAGALLFGKLNMDEFAMGATTETSYFGITKNPWNLSHVPGGSSGGSAAAVAAEEIFFALGSDTGGSIRQPAAYCGITGLKPTYGTVSRYGLVAFSSSFDQIGPMARSAEDCALVLNAIAGPDKRDMTLFPKNSSFQIDSDFNITDYKLGYIPESDLENVQTAISEVYQDTAKVFEHLHMQISCCSLPLSNLYIPIYYILSSAEASANLARYNGIRYGFQAETEENFEELMTTSRSLGFGNEVKRRILLGTFVLSEVYYHAYYFKAQMLRRKIIRAYEDLFEKVDLLLLPTTFTTAPKLGTTIQNPVDMYRSDLFTVAANLAGLPAISFPCGFDEKGLPIGLQLMAARGMDHLLLNAVHIFQKNTDYHSMIAKGMQR